MMGNYYGMGGYGNYGLFGGVIQLLMIAFLILGIAYFWKELQKKR